MSIEVKVPQLPESVADATLVAWHKKAGDPVRREENLVDLETDKVVLEVPAPADGIIREIVASDGAVVTSGQLLAILEPGAVAAAVPASKDKAPAAAKAASPPKAAPPPAAQPPPAEEPASPAAQQRSSASANKMGPAVRKLVEEHDLDPGAIAGSGREGRITKGDVLDYIADHQATTVGIEHDVLSRAGVSAATGSEAAGRYVAQRAPRRHDAPARAHRGTFAASAATSRDADDVQRSRHDGRHGAAPTLSRGIHGEARHQARLHVVLRQSLDRGPAPVPGAQRIRRRQRHHLSRVLRHRRRRLDGPRARRARPAQRRGRGLRCHRAGDSRLRRARAERLAADGRADGRHVHDHERRHLRLDDVDADLESRRKAAFSACTRSRNGPWSSTARSKRGR